MATDGRLTKEDILRALELLNSKLAADGTRAEVCIYGGTSMVLAFNARLSTKDVDAVFVPKTEVARLVQVVSEELGLGSGWMNDGVKGYVSDKPDFTSAGLPQFSNIDITRPTTKYLFAMKCIAARSPGYEGPGDKQDILFLMKHLNISSVDQALDIVEEYYPRDRIVPKTQFLIQECVSELANPSNI